jgi:non-specific serine/threonine protein kinase
MNFILTDDSGYMVTEYLEGESLPNYLERQGRHFLNYNQFRKIMEPVLGAVGYLHKNLVLHRDISPENIMVDKLGRSTLVDLGSAKHYMATHRLSEQTTLIPYKDRYSPPEQQAPAAERPEGFYTDIFALAGTFYWGWLATGRHHRCTARLPLLIPTSRSRKCLGSLVRRGSTTQ